MSSRRPGEEKKRVLQDETKKNPRLFTRQEEARQNGIVVCVQDKACFPVLDFAHSIDKNRGLASENRSRKRNG